MARTITSASVFPDHGFPLRIMRIPSHREAEVHSHEFYELVLILAGSGRHITPTEDYRIEAGDVFVISGETSHGYADTESMSLVNILFQPRRLRLPTADLGNIPGYHVLFTVEPRFRKEDGFRSRLRLGVEELAQAARIVVLLEDELERRAPGYRFMACSHLMALMGHLSRSYTEMELPEGRPLLRIGEILSLMETHYHDPMTLGTLTQIAGMSESTLTRTFHKVVGRSPIEHLIRISTRKAKDLLRQDDFRITEIAMRCGFNDSNYFSRQFGKVVGCSPREYRRATR